MANDTTAAASVQPMTAESAANAIEAMMSVEDGEQQNQEAQQEEEQSDSEESFDNETVAEEDAATDEESDEDQSDEDVEEEQPEEAQSFTVKVDGKEVQVTIDELKQGYSRTEDYTRKTQALAQERKAAQAEFEQVRAERQQYAQLLGALQQQLAQAEPQLNLDELYSNDPIEWVRQKELQRERNEKLLAIQSEQQRLAQMQQAEQQQYQRNYLESQKNALLQAMPQLRDPKVAAQERDRWLDAGKSIGFSDQELSGITDHRMLLALKTIADYRGIISKRQQIKPQQKVMAKPATPGNSKSVGQKSSDVKKSQQRLRQTGNVKDAASLIEKFL